MSDTNYNVVGILAGGDTYDSASPNFEPYYSESRSESESEDNDDYPSRRARRRRNRNGDHHESAKRLAEAVELGTIREVKRLYEGKSKCRCCINWVDEPPEKSDETPADGARKSKQLYAGWAVVARTQRHGGNHGEWKVSDITIQSPAIKQFLGKVLDGYPGVFVHTDHIEVGAPFQPFLHRWEEFLRLEGEASEETKKDVKLLKEVVQPELQKYLRAADECRTHGVIEYVNLWTIFRPGSLVYWNRDGVESIVRLVNIDTHFAFAAEYFRLHCEQVDWNGQHFGYATPTLFISSYKGHKTITELDIFPLSMHPDPKGLKQRMVERGRKFEQLKGYHYKFYTGDTRTTRGSFAEKVSKIPSNAIERLS